MYRNSVWSLFFILLLFNCHKDQTDTIKIAAVLPLTGNSSYIGQSLKNGIELGLMEINSDTDSKIRLSVEYEDTMNDPKSGISAVKKTLTDSNIKVIISAMSTVTKAIIPITIENKIPLIATAVSSDSIAAQSPLVYRFFTKAEIDAKAMAEYAYNVLKLKKVAILYIQDDFGISYSKIFKEIFESLGGETISDNFFYGETNFSSIITKLKPFQPEGIYILSYSNNLAIIPRQIQELGLKTKILSIGTIAQQFIIDQAGGTIEGAYYTTNAFNTRDPKTEEMKSFVEKYQSHYGNSPEYFEVFGYDAINLIKEAIMRGQGTRQGIKDGLDKIENYNGVSGEISIDESGEINFPIIISQVKNSIPSEPLITIIP